MSTGLFHYHLAYPFKMFGLTSPFWTVHADTILHTWIAMGILFILAIIGRKTPKESPGIISFIYEEFLFFFLKLYQDSSPFFCYRHFAFVISLFLFTLFACLVGLLPFLDEATKDIHTTLALGLSSFIYVQYQRISLGGLKSYLIEFTKPFFPLTPLNIVGEVTKIASMSFRLFGNIIGGGIILSMVIDLIARFEGYFIIYALGTFITKMIVDRSSSQGIMTYVRKLVNILFYGALFLAWGQLFFGVFEGIIQSFVITMLTITYLTLGLEVPESLQEEAPLP